MPERVPQVRPCHMVLTVVVNREIRAVVLYHRRRRRVGSRRATAALLLSVIQVGEISAWVRKVGHVLFWKGPELGKLRKFFLAVHTGPVHH